MTEKLYYNEPYIVEFDANIIGIEESDKNKYSVLLDKTFFYPTSGGQPFDTGLLNNLNIIDVIEKDGNIFHITENVPELGQVKAKINWDRRLEHMQIHSGQHILSQAFIQVMDAPTFSFHLGSETATIDIKTPDLSINQADEVENLANRIIYQNRKVNVLYVEQEDVEELNLRKKPKKMCSSGDIRVIEVEDFDLSPCGGTHVTQTGEIGIIKIISWEKYKGNVRVEFTCGKRALNDYRFKNRALKNIATKFSAKEKQIEEIINKSIDELKMLQKSANFTRKQLTEYISRDLLNNVENFKNNKLIIRSFDDTDLNALKFIGLELLVEKDVIAFLTSSFNGKTQFILCCSDNVPLNLNIIAQDIFKIINGKGGGKPHFIQGSGELVKIDFILEKASELIKFSL